MKKLTVLLTALCLMGLTSQGLCATDLINIQFNNGTPIYNNGAAVNDETQVWNQITTAAGEYDNLKYSDNTSSAVYILMDANDLFSTLSSVHDIDGNLMNSYCAFGAPGYGYGDKITIAGLSAGQYKVYVYSQGVDDTTELNMSATGNDGLTSQDYLLSPLGDETSLIQGKNWQVRTIDVDGNGTITMSFKSDAELLTSVVNGIQIQAVPEPGSMVLLGVGGVLALSRVRRKAENDLAVID